VTFTVITVITVPAVITADPTIITAVMTALNAVSMSLAGGGDVTTEQLEEQFGSVEDVT
jgi:hypothetical protein